MCGAVIAMLLSRVLWKVHSKDHAMTASTSSKTRRATITTIALHHYQGRNSAPDMLGPM
jgi:hypothetical protein